MTHTLFEVSWEVCNKVGGIHTVISTKAKTLASRYGDDYVCLGPWLMSYNEGDVPFEESQGFDDFCEACRSLGVPVRVGRWLIPGRPRTILVEFSQLYDKLDGVLAGLWERHQVDSITGVWDYKEPVLFGHACGMVIQKWCEDRLLPQRGRAVAQFHEWMTASGMLYLKDTVPAIGTVFTTHATMLGRSIASTGVSPTEGLGGREPEQAAEAHGVRSKHSLEGVASRAADVFTTVSEITADESQVFHRRRPTPILPNGIDLDVIDEMAGPTERDAARAALENLASKFLGQDMAGAAMFCISGRYEFHNKGIDLFLDSLEFVNRRAGRPIVAFILVPAGTSGVKGELIKRLASSDKPASPMGISTHNLFDEENDPVHKHCRQLGLVNAASNRVKVVQVPIYLGPKDGVLNLPYYAVLRAMDLSVFPSFYEPWGYTPEESLAVGVPTISSDYAGFGRWVRAEGLGASDGVHVLTRIGVDGRETALALEDILESFLGSHANGTRLYDVCRRTAQRTAWSDLIRHYYEAYDAALAAARRRLLKGETRHLVPKAAPAKAALPEGGPRLVPFEVSATLPKALLGLERLAANYWWSWDHDAMRLFEEISPVRWEACRHNPVRFLREVFPEDLEARAKDGEFVARLQRVLSRFEDYMARASSAPTIAYFSAEFAIHESLKVYSGGLGVLAGDHLKSASDLNQPLLGIGLFYRQGYIRQRLTASGDQVAEEEPNDPRLLPVERVIGRDGRPLEIDLQLPSSRLILWAWKVRVGRVPLYLLDADVADNRPEDRTITHRLYGGDSENRVRQEIVLGRGGVRLLQELGIEPAVFHINEGHAAFLSLERVRRLLRDPGLTFDEAREVCRATTVFTTHTPVPAGHDRFSEDIMRRYFADAPSWVGVPWERFLELGRAPGQTESFNMTYLAMSFAGIVNGVSRLHGQVSQQLLHPMWPGLLVSETPVKHVTNGVHLPTWISPEMARLLRRDERLVSGEDYAERAAKIEPKALWSVLLDTKRRLLQKVRADVQKSFRTRHDSPAMLGRMLEALDETALYIGFARRFAPYKRAHLLFQNLDRLAAIVGDAKRPVRILFAGKAHPQDGHGQQLLKRVAEIARSERFLGKILFLENYDAELARYLVQGVDVWLNTPTRPLEASGTSGMKAAANGGLNLSIEDGWWAEAADGTNGWSIGEGNLYEDQALQDELDATTLYTLLEEEVVPLWFDRQGGLPLRWLERVKRSLATIPPFFNTDRMVRQYAELAYGPLARSSAALVSGRYALARTLAERHQRIRKSFGDIRFVDVHTSDLTGVKVGHTIEVSADVELGSLTADDIVVEFVLGHTRGKEDVHNLVVIRLSPTASPPGLATTFTGSHVVERCGSFSGGVRVRVRQEGVLDTGLADLVLWV